MTHGGARVSGAGGALWGFGGAWQLLQLQPLPLKPCVHNPVGSTCHTELLVSAVDAGQVGRASRRHHSKHRAADHTSAVNKCFWAEQDLLLRLDPHSHRLGVTSASVQGLCSLGSGVAILGSALTATTVKLDSARHVPHNNMPFFFQKKTLQPQQAARQLPEASCSL